MAPNHADTHAASTGASYHALLRLPGYPPLATGLALGELAESMSAVGLVIFLLHTLHSPSLAGLAIAAKSAPQLLSGAFAGVLLDRVRRRSLLIALDLLTEGAVLLVLPLLAWSGHFSIPIAVALLAVTGLTGPLSITGFRTLTPTLVPQNQLSRANAVDSMLMDTGSVAGPALAGALVLLAGASATVLVQGILTLGAAALVLRVAEPVRRPQYPAWFPSILGGLAEVARNRGLQGTVLNMCLSYVGFGILTLALPLAVSANYGAAQQASGLIWATISLGSIAGALIYGWRRPSGGDGAHMSLATAAIGAGMVLLAAASVFPLALLAALLIGAASGPATVAMLTLRQHLVPEALRGRVFALVIALNLSGYPIGSALAALLIAHTGVTTLLALAAACQFAACAAGALLIRSRTTGRPELISPASML